MSLTAWQVGRGPSSAPRSVERPAPASARSAHAVRRLRNLSARLDFCQPWWFVARQAAVECSHQIHVPASYWFRDRQASYFRILTVSSGIEAGFWGWFPGTGPCSFEHSPTLGRARSVITAPTRAARGPGGPYGGLRRMGLGNMQEVLPTMTAETPPKPGENGGHEKDTATAEERCHRIGRRAEVTNRRKSRFVFRSGPALRRRRRRFCLHRQFLHAGESRGQAASVQPPGPQSGGAQPSVGPASGVAKRRPGRWAGGRADRK